MRSFPEGGLAASRTASGVGYHDSKVPPCGMPQDCRSPSPVSPGPDPASGEGLGLHMSEMESLSPLHPKCREGGGVLQPGPVRSSSCALPSPAHPASGLPVHVTGGHNFLCTTAVSQRKERRPERLDLRPGTSRKHRVPAATSHCAAVLLPALPSGQVSFY